MERSLATLKLPKKEKKGLRGVLDAVYYSGEALRKIPNLGGDFWVAIPKLKKSNPVYNLSLSMIRKMMYRFALQKKYLRQIIIGQFCTIVK